MRTMTTTITAIMVMTIIMITAIMTTAMIMTTITMTMIITAMTTTIRAWGTLKNWWDPLRFPTESEKM